WKARKGKYKYCLAPGCKSTSVSTPDKLFISLPRDTNSRKLWQKAMHRKAFVSDKGTPISTLCFSLFQLETDIENYMQIKLMHNVKIRMKPGVVPHIFDCQEKVAIRGKKDCPQFLKRCRQISTTKNSDPSSTAAEAVPIENQTTPIHNSEESKPAKEQCFKQIQVNLKLCRVSRGTQNECRMASKGIQCNIGMLSGET
ncbi:hypothetical protein NQ317_005183, partial [Molorchus minor]